MITLYPLKTFTIKLTAAIFGMGYLISGAHAQVDANVDVSMTPVELVQEVLLGAGVAVFNIEANGTDGTTVNNQFGRYHGTSDVIEFPEGLVMGSNRVILITDTFPPFEPLTNVVTNDPDLMAISGFNMNNNAILEFDFIPNGDSLEFRYIFASREYPSFTCSTFNDAFGFFISGPGITGPFTDGAENIALIPDTDVPVGVNTLNSGTPSGGNEQPCLDANPDYVEHSVYFVNNDPNAEGDINIPGMTQTLTAYANVICGETYHIKLAIGDAVDTALPSYVFLEAESFSSNSAVQVDLDIPIGINDSTLYRGCGEAKLTFIRPPASQAITDIAYLDISGTAINGIDVVPNLPDSIVFSPGVDTLTFILTAPFLGTATGEDTFTVTITNIASDCGGGELTSSFTFYINDAEPLAIEPGGQFALEDCNDEVQLTAEPSGGYGGYQYLWSTGSTSQTITVSPGFTTNYFVTVSDTCDAGSVSTSFSVEVPQYPPVVVTLPEDIVLDVCDVPVVIPSEVEGGFGNYTYQWRNMNTNEIIGDQPVLEYVVETTTTIRLIVTDDCGATGIQDIEVTVPPVEVDVFLPEIFTATSCLDDIMMPAISEGGIGFTTYSWFVDGAQVAQTTAAFFNYNPSMGQQVVIKAEDECGNFDTDSIFVDFNFPPVVVEATPDTSICDRTDALLRLVASEGSGGFRYEWLQTGDVTDTIRVAPRENSSYDWVVTDTCGMRQEGRIRVDVREVIASFEFDYLEYYGVQIRNLSRPAFSTYFWDFGDGFTTTEPNPSHQFADVVPYTITLTATDDAGCEDTFTRSTTPPAEVYIPTAFSPNGDGINELFTVQGSNITEFEIWIHDRWGKVVYHSTDIDEGWNGSHNGGAHHNNMTLYNYFIRYRGIFEEDAFERTGSIVVIR